MDVKIQAKALLSTSSIYAPYHASQHSILMSKPLFADCYAAKIELTERPAIHRNPTMYQLADIARKPNVGGVHSSPVHFLLPSKSKLNFQSPVKFFASPSMQKMQNAVDQSIVKDLPTVEVVDQNGCGTKTIPPQGLKPINSLQNMRRKSVSTIPHLEGLPKPKAAGRKKSSKRPKSSKHRRKKSNSSKTNRRNEKVATTIPVKKNLSSCFSLYSDNMSRTDQPKLDITSTVLTIDKYNINKIPQCKSAYEPRRSNIKLPPRTTNCLSLPPTSTTKFTENVKTFSHHLSLPGSGDLRTEINANTQLPTDDTTLETNTLPQSAVLLSDDNLKPTTKKFTLPKQAHKEIITRKSLQTLTAENSLSNRLSLIHHYGNDYHAVTQRAAEQRRKAIARKEHRTRENEKEMAEKQKQEQRKKIYALNNLMTNLEIKNFKEFYKSIHGPK